jgi:hypothetical protein
MAEIVTLEAFEVQPGTRSGHLVLITGDERYKRILRRAFPASGFTHSFPDAQGRYGWGTYIHDLPDRRALERFLHLLTQHPCIFDDFDECFVLGRHGEWDPQTDTYRRTELGAILNRAKPYGPGDGDRRAADQLAERLAAFVEAHPAYARADAIVPVPTSNPNKPFDLPTYLADRLAERLGKTNGAGWVRKVRVTNQQKDLHTHQQKVENVDGAFEAVCDVSGQTVVVVDDLYQSGATINEVGRTLRAGDPSTLLGLAVTKTQKDV